MAMTDCKGRSCFFVLEAFCYLSKRRLISFSKKVFFSTEKKVAFVKGERRREKRSNWIFG